MFVCFKNVIVNLNNITGIEIKNDCIGFLVNDDLFTTIIFVSEEDAKNTMEEIVKCYNIGKRIYTVPDERLR